MTTRSKRKKENEITDKKLDDAPVIDSTLPPVTPPPTNSSIPSPQVEEDTFTSPFVDSVALPESKDPLPLQIEEEKSSSATDLPAEKGVETEIETERQVSPHPLIDIESDDDDNDDIVTLGDVETQPPVDDPSLETDLNLEDVGDYYTYVQSAEPPRIFKNSDAVAYNFSNDRPSPDFYIELLRFGRSLTKFVLYQLQQSAFEKGCKVHVSALVEYEVIKDEIVVDRPEYFIATRNRVFLRDDDDIPEAVAEICSALRAETEDIAARGSNFQFKRYHYFKVTTCKYQPAAFGETKNAYRFWMRIISILID